MKCNGDSAEACGGPNRLTVYRYSSSGTDSSTDPDPEPSTGKRGLCYNDNNPSGNAVYANLFKGYSKVLWGYDWGFTSDGLDLSFEFVGSQLCKTYASNQLTYPGTYSLGSPRWSRSRMDSRGSSRRH